MTAQNYNLKKGNNYLKEEIGEIIIKNQIKYCHRPRELPRDFLKKKFPFKNKKK